MAPSNVGSRVVALRDAIAAYHAITARTNAARILEAEARAQEFAEPPRTSSWPRGGGVTLPSFP